MAFRVVLAAGGHRDGGGVSWTLSMGGTIRIRDKSISILLVGYDIRIPRHEEKPIVIHERIYGRSVASVVMDDLISLRSPKLENMDSNIYILSP